MDLVKSMSYCRQEGKDQIVFTTKEDHKQPSTVQIPKPEQDLEEILLDGSINWNCPLLEGRATGPCGVEFREVFECVYHNSEADTKESDCFVKIRELLKCSSKYPMVYGKRFGDEEKDEFQSEGGQMERQFKSVKS